VRVSLDGVDNDGEAGEGDNVISASAVAAGRGADVLVGSRDDESLSGGAGDDVIRAGAGSDRTEGGPGTDVLKAGAGNDPWL
jgi:Ca2+-binding RTX toxin-like protein